ncbi:MAG: CoA-binding protein [Candidatus Tectomicrobia bacterium]|nr:CoA-binding protein [Candidatus Tectomicrobia bacterium]
MPPATFGEEVRRILESIQTIAVVGLSPSPERPSYGVSRYMQDMGYTIIPIRPGGGRILGQSAYASLQESPVPIDMVNIFRRPEFVPSIVDAAIACGAKVVWMQEGVVHHEAAEKARQAGMQVVQDACVLKAHKFFGLPRRPERGVSATPVADQPK